MCVCVCVCVCVCATVSCVTCSADVFLQETPSLTTVDTSSPPLTKTRTSGLGTVHEVTSVPSGTQTVTSPTPTGFTAGGPTTPSIVWEWSGETGREPTIH